MTTSDSRLSSCQIIIVGASGDLSRKKLIPALFSLFCNELLPASFHVIGYARTEYSDGEFREAIIQHLTCRYEPEADNCSAKMDEFLSRCHYVAGNYADADRFDFLKKRIHELAEQAVNLLFYMAIPPSIFLECARSIESVFASEIRPLDNWPRVVLEKPFGMDSDSSASLVRAVDDLFQESQLYRIDHYLGKEVIQNLLILRFANLIFEPVWNRNYIDSVSISWSETIGCEGRAGYFDRFGIIRDVVQNHLLQIVALIAMEQPKTLDAGSICDEKGKLLSDIRPLRTDDVIVGQYSSSIVDGNRKAGYLDDPEVPADSVTPTYVGARLSICNSRWAGVPFHIKAGKAVDTNMTEIGIRFKPLTNSPFSNKVQLTPNRLVIRVQPNEAIELHVMNKYPGLGQKLESAKLNLLYKSTYGQILPDAYERLLLDVIRGDRSLFIRADELAAAWDVVTPLLHELENSRVRPVSYPYGSAGPEAAADHVFRS